MYVFGVDMPLNLVFLIYFWLGVIMLLLSIWIVLKKR